MRALLAYTCLAMLLASIVVWRLQPGSIQDGRKVLLWVSDDNPTRQAQLGLFNRLNRRYRVVLDPSNQGVEKVIVQSMAGVGPDMVDSYTAFDVGAYVQSGVAWDVTDELARRGVDVRKDCFRGMLGAAMYDGRVYGVPADMSVDAVFYHRRIFDQEGLPYPKGPWRWEDLARLAQKLTERDSTGRIVRYGLMFSWNWQLFFATYGAHVFSPDGTRSDLDSPEAIAAVQMMWDLVYRYRVAPTPFEEASMSSQGGWGSGAIDWFGADPPRCAMAIGGRWWLAKMRDFSNRDYGVAESPNGGSRCFFGYGRATLINRYSPNREGALEFLAYLATAAYNREVNQDADGICAFRKFSRDPAFLHDPKHPDEKDNEVWRLASELARPDEGSVFVDGATVSRIISKQLELVQNNYKSPAQAMRQAAADIDAAIAQSVGEDPVLAARYARLRPREPAR